MISYAELIGRGANLQPRGSYLSGVSITLGVIGSTPVNSGSSFGMNDLNISLLGGGAMQWGVTYPQTLFKTTRNLTYSDGTKGGLQGKVAFETDATSFDLRLYSTGVSASFVLLIDGKEVNSTMFAMPQDGSLRYVTVDLAGAGLSSGYHSVEFEFYGGANFGGLTLSQGAHVRPLSDSGPRIVFLGDSFTEGTGSQNSAEDYPSLVARGLGITDSWQSALGGTGWITPNGKRPALVGRIGPDGIDAHGDIYVIAMGINDPLIGLYDGVLSTLTQLTQAMPLAKIFVIGPWSVAAPGPTLKSPNNEVIKSVTALFPGVIFLDASDVTYTKSDPTHPDAAGHWVLAEWVSAQIKQHLGADGIIEQNVAGDVVGPVFLKGFDPNETYQATVLENGQVSSRFELVLNGTPYPVLKLKDAQSISSVSPIEVSVNITGSLGTSYTTSMSFDVRQHTLGDAGNNYIRAPQAGGFIEGQAGNDYLIGSGVPDRLLGGNGDDKLDGGLGGDTMFGGAGNDVYWVDSIADIVSEQPSDGYETVISSLNGYVLPDYVEGLNLAGTVTSGSGNDGPNYLRGNELANLLYGRGGDDRLDGFGGNDTLYGDAGNDFLFGGAGADIMYGGTGNDNYFVDDAGDRVIEGEGSGSDLVTSTLASYTLTANVERLTLDVGGISGTGNDLANAITGNAAANVLTGSGGNDTLVGNAGNDTLAGGDGSDTLSGGDGNDILSGGLGTDNLTGGAGADVFAFDTAANAATKDAIADFTSGVDKLQFSQASFAGLSLGNLSSDAFYSSATATTAQDASDRIIYNTTTGALYYDADGLGGAAAIQIAVLGTTTHPALAYTDIQTVI